jgi:hypothetical protein
LLIISRAGYLCLFGRLDTVGEFPKQRTYGFHSTEFKELTRLKLNSPTVSDWRYEEKNVPLAAKDEETRTAHAINLAEIVFPVIWRTNNRLPKRS